MGKLRDEERDVIEHSLGLSRGKGEFRNYFCTHPGATDWPTVQSLVQLGFMRESHKINEERDTIFKVTDAGRAALHKTV